MTRKCRGLADDSTVGGVVGIRPFREEEGKAMIVRKNQLKSDLAAGKVCCGCVVSSRSPVIVEMLGYSGFDWLFIDTEHVPIESGLELENLIRAAEASNIVPLVRVKENKEHYIRNALEAGAQGVVIPHVATKEAAENAVRFARFPLRGIRGADPTVRSAKYKCGNFDWEIFVKESNAEIMVIPLLEDKEFLDNLEDILSVEGIDAVCFGATDYALSLGLNLLYDFNHEKIKSAFELVVQAANRKGIPIVAAVNPCTVEQSKKLADMGVKLQHFSTDLTIIGGAFRALMNDVISKVK
jgi:4-hydroxy-2-oxoheptanedioate aldolase